MRKTPSQIQEEKVTPTLVIGCMLPLLGLGILFAYLFIKTLIEW